MPKPLVHTGSPLIKLLDGVTSTGEGSWVKFDGAYRRFALQGAANSTAAVIILQGRLTGDSTAITTLATFSRTTDGVSAIKYSTGGQPILEIRAVLNAGASSGGASAWAAATA